MNGFQAKAVKIIMCFLAAVAANEYLFDGKADTKNGAVGVLLLILFTIMAFQRPANRMAIRKTAAIGACIAAVVLVIGTSVYRTDSTLPLYETPANIAITFFLVLGAAWGLFLLLERFLAWFDARALSAQPLKAFWWFTGNAQSLFVCWGIIFLCWIPCLLAYWPGVLSYDAPMQFHQINNNELSDFIPMLHTLFLKLCLVSVGRNYQAATLVHSLSQMTIMSFCFSFALFYMARLRIRRFVRFCGLGWFALAPFNAAFSLVMAKNVFCAGVMLIMGLMILDLARRPIAFTKNAFKMISLGVLCLLFAQLNNNALYALIIVAICMPLMLRPHWWKTLLVFGTAAVLAWGIANPLYAALNLKYGGGEESVSVPCQQIALACKKHWHELTQDQQNKARELFNENPGGMYNPRNADPTKGQLKGKEGYYKDLFTLWAELGRKYPQEYLDAFLTLNVQMWYPDNAYPDRHSNRMYIEDGIGGWGGQDVERRSKSQPLYNFYNAFSQNKASWQHLPVVATLCSVGTPVWLCFLALLLCAIKKKSRYAMALLPVVALWITHMAGPVTNLRYMYPLIASYPLYLAVVVAAVVRKREIQRQNP
ncbi:MAG: DUF6020 family protein [Clostridia bacterium]|nr:DUF6020 family protein [Clostridia bacterium]